MASGSPDIEEPYQQEDQVSTDNQSGHFSDHEIDPNAATQMIENGRSFHDQVNLVLFWSISHFILGVSTKFYISME